MSAMQPPQRVPGLQGIGLRMYAQCGLLETFAFCKRLFQADNNAWFPQLTRQHLYQSSAYHRPKSNSVRCVNHTGHCELGGGEAELQRLTQAM